MWFKAIINYVTGGAKYYIIAITILSLLSWFYIHQQSVIADATKELREKVEKQDLYLKQDTAALKSTGEYIQKIRDENDALMAKVEALEYGKEIAQATKEADKIYGTVKEIHEFTPKHKDTFDITDYYH